MQVQPYKKSKNFIYHTIMIILSLIMIYPFVWSTLSSFKTIDQLYTGNPLNILPRPFTLENYKRLFEVLPFGKFILNSIVLSIAIPFSMIVIASITAYALTRLNFKGRNIIFLAFIATMMIPSHVTLIPNYKTIVDLNLYNTYTALFLTSMFTATNAFNIFFFRQFFLSIPKDLENAAIIDGCSRIRIFFKIILPNSKPAIATTAILSFRTVWNQFLWPMIVINDFDKMTLTVGLKYLKEWDSNWAVLLAGATISIVPIILVFFAFQKYFISSSMNAGFGGR
ncbi:multiple sugar transport system permease protein [Hydrogenoanaerobacterium saccharovorans]|uniref:Carbohydrate ABC transporter membrane protein 2, CUT1 family n=1 Tax=Hydrogenoanaerobacterium saccharovorans TaxID=474960 RepID=A0A1H7YV28_9FIRM|nr:carbohydrate ABC transporter permease [Hydrogenoanaerobacterium saccharovorans]RPF48991.1 multiple sugar transport system permease protein [Hydrogenoanaerobacterium saccharovorans]SEM49960.1 carbohydrate ABC transporter membrane protein 2, CUT1 family [Hydrogenoanaerobacterium saccharovorans]